MISKEKSKFIVPELNYLGYVVTPDELQVDSEKVNAILKMPRPTKAKEVRGTLGMLSWYRRFIGNFQRSSLRCHC